MKEEEPAPVEKRKRGNPKFVKGVSGNPAGRGKGNAGKFAIEQAKKVADSGLTPLDFLIAMIRAEPEDLKRLKIAKEDVTPTMRMRAAESAAPYVHRKMPIAIEGALPGDPISVVVKAFPTDPKLAADAYRKLIGGKS